MLLRMRTKGTLNLKQMHEAKHCVDVTLCVCLTLCQRFKKKCCKHINLMVSSLGDSADVVVLFLH